MFNKSNDKPVPTFESRSEAFDYMFTKMCERGADMMDAAEKANKFADIIAKNKALPDAPAKPQTVIEKGACYLKQVVEIKRDYPEVWDLAAGAIGGLIGAFAGSKSIEDDEEKEEPLDFNNIE